MNIPLKAADGQAKLSLPGNTEIIGQQWEKPTYKSLLRQSWEDLIEALTLLPFVYILIYHKKLNYLCSLTCMVINVLIMLFPSNLSPCNLDDVCLNTANPLEVNAELSTVQYAHTFLWEPSDRKGKLVIRSLYMGDLCSYTVYTATFKSGLISLATHRCRLGNKKCQTRKQNKKQSKLPLAGSSYSSCEGL